MAYFISYLISLQLGNIFSLSYTCIALSAPSIYSWRWWACYCMYRVTVSSFQRKHSLVKGVWLADTHSIVSFLTESSSWNHSLTETFPGWESNSIELLLHLNTKIHAFFSVPIILSWVRKIVRPLSLGLKFKVFTFYKNKYVWWVSTTMNQIISCFQ